MPAKLELAPVPPKEAIDFFRKKGTHIGFDHRDTTAAMHATSFTVAKAMGYDILNDIRAEMDLAIAEGRTLKQFADNLRPTLQAKGWWGRKMMTDPLTGKEREVQLGSPRRLRTIFDTNMRTAYAAGQWERIDRLKDARPYLRYVAVMDERTRDAHRALHGTVLSVVDKFWDTYYPPNGWRCRCTIQQLSARDLDRRGLSVSPRAPEQPPRRWVNRRTGQVETAPQGIDPGFATNVGKARLKALTPPPLDRPLAVPYHGDPAAVPMPKPRQVPSSDILPDGLTDQDYIHGFLAKFGATAEKPVVYIDRSGAPMVISEELFRDSQGKLKVKKRGRHQYLPLLARAIMDPDEIWSLWQEYPNNRMVLTRHYVARFDVSGKDVPAFVMFSLEKDGWYGVTAFPASKDEYLVKNRRGALVYRRSEKP